jgi:hypothetical protein
MRPRKTTAGASGFVTSAWFDLPGATPYSFTHSWVGFFAGSWYASIQSFASRGNTSAKKNWQRSPIECAGVVKRRKGGTVPRVPPIFN